MILRHVEPSGASHLDWLLAPDDGSHGDDARVLIHFRCGTSPTSLSAGDSVEVERGGPHRWRYLEFEGELTDGRGRVSRVAQGEVEILDTTESALAFRVRWGEHWQEWEALHKGGDRWRLERKA